jgi:N-acetylmuramoyl-L-alanine amidase
MENGEAARTSNSHAEFWRPLWYSCRVWRPRLLATLSLAGVALLMLPIYSQPQVQQPAAPAPQENPAAGASQGASSTAAEGPGLTVVLDPAHGGADFGARGPTGLAESDVVLDFARTARIALEAQRLRVLLTREGNQDPSFDTRSAMINGLRNTIFVSLHVSSSGPVGTARTYYYAFPSDAGGVVNSTASSTAAPQTSAAQITARTSLIEWDHAQRSSVELSRQLATLTQTQLLPRFRGSPAMPIAAPVRQLRTIAAPAIAVEISSIDVTDAKRLEQMAQPLADAIGKAVAEFHFPATTPAAGIGTGH